MLVAVLLFPLCAAFLSMRNLASLLSLARATRPNSMLLRTQNLPVMSHARCAYSMVVLNTLRGFQLPLPLSLQGLLACQDGQSLLLPRPLQGFLLLIPSPLLLNHADRFPRSHVHDV